MMGFDDSLPIERYQNPKSKNAVLAMGNVFSATDCIWQLFMHYLEQQQHLFNYLFVRRFNHFVFYTTLALVHQR